MNHYVFEMLAKQRQQEIIKVARLSHKEGYITTSFMDKLNQRLRFRQTKQAATAVCCCC
ncbi:hypothetical protein [Paenibacillus sp. EPM92]|uniref:hypothetical protein n=1 Tax=Paenibacillus sp. EPM92 TaxID=1561195 RepID=UPI0019154E5D|nr:hypothetical protein [Paenibacillus sp. EPM92]